MFNKEALEFLTKMIKSFPEIQKLVDYKIKYERTLLFDKKAPMKLFMQNLEPYGIQIMSKNEIFFKNNEYVNNAENISGHLGLVEIWDSIEPVTKNAIWGYIQNLYCIGMKILGKENELKQIIVGINNDINNGE